MDDSDSSADHSDEEFWEDLDKRLAVPRPAEQQQVKLASPQRVEDPGPDSNPGSARFAHLLSPKADVASEWDKENTSQRLENIVLAQEEEVSSASIIIKNQTQKQLGQSVEHMTRDYKKTIGVDFLERQIQ